MPDFNDKAYDKGYNDGHADALNNLELDDILDYIPELPEEDRQKILEAINNCE